MPNAAKTRELPSDHWVLAPQPKPRYPVQVLRQMRDYLGDRRHWLKGDMGIVNTGLGTKLTYPNGAVCLVGARDLFVGFNAPSVNVEVTEILRTAIIETTGSMYSIVEFNDNVATHKHLMAMFDRALKLVTLRPEKRRRHIEAALNGHPLVKPASK